MASKNKRTIYLGLDYSQFTGGVTEINRKMALLDAEFKLASQQAKNYGNETDTLGLKTEYLTQKIALQNQKVEEAKKAYDAAMASENASAKEIDELDKRLLQERLKLEQLNGQLKENQQATDKATESNRSLDKEMELLDARFKLATQEASNYGSETDQLALKQDYLTEKIGIQNKKVEEAKKAYDAAIASNEATQAEIDDLDKKLLEEKTSLEQLKGELKETQKQTSGLEEADKKLNSTMKSLAVGITAALGTLFKFAKDTADTADELNTLSIQTGLTTTEIQKLQYAANFVDVSFETMSGSITRLERNMASARDGSKDMTEAFKKLHVRVTENNGQLKDANTIFYECIDALGKVRNETELDTLAMTIFGKSAKELKPLIDAGTDALKMYGDEAEKTGKIMSEDEVNSANKFKDSMDRLNTSLDRIKQVLGESLMPLFEEVSNFLGSMNPKAVAITAAIAGIVALIWKAVTAITALSAAMAAHSGVQMVFNTVSLKSIAIIAAVVAGVILLVMAIKALVGGTEKFKQDMEAAEGSVKRIGDSINGAQTSVNKVGRNASGTDYWQGGQTWIGEEGPELVTLPRGSRITPAGEAAGTGTTINYYYMTIDPKNVKDFNDIVELAQQQRMALRRT